MTIKIDSYDRGLSKKISTNSSGEENSLLLERSDTEDSQDQAHREDIQKNKPLTELEQIEAIQRKSTNFIFIFGGPARGKTVVTSSIVNFLSSVDSEGQLTPFDVKKGKDHGNSLLQKILRLFAEKRFPARTTLVGDDEPIYLNVRFTPNNSRDHKALNLTFLEMPGDELQKIDSPEGGYGELPVSIDVFFKTVKTSISFILLTEHGRAAEDDQLIASFIDYVRSKNKNFSDTRFLLLVSKWDKYDEGLSVDEFVKLNMRLTYSKIHNSKHSISDFSIGEVDDADEVPFLQSYNPVPAKRVINWIYTNITNKPLYKRKLSDRIISKFIKYS